MIVTTGPNIEGKKITEYCGIVNGESILGANIFRDVLANVRDIVGGRSGAYEKSLRKSREIALDEMIARAQELGANAIIAVDIDYESISGGSGNMMMVTASGTAVKYS